MLDIILTLLQYGFAGAIIMLIILIAIDVLNLRNVP